MSRNQAQFVANATLDVSEVPVSDMSVRDIVSKISLSGGQGFVHCPCKKGNCKSGRRKCRRLKVMCNSRCHMSLSSSHKEAQLASGMVKFHNVGILACCILCLFCF